MTRINERIRAPRVRVLVGDENEQLGIIPTHEALAKARSLGLDLIEIAPNADPPVCRITDYGKFRYNQSKQKKEQSRPKSKLKEVKFRVRIETNDYQVKMARAERFLDHGDKLRIQLQFRGREMAHQELGFQLMERIKEDLKTMAHVDVEPRQAGRNVLMMLSPLPEQQRKRKFTVHDEEEESEEEKAGIAEAEAEEAAEKAGAAEAAAAPEPATAPEPETAEREKAS